MGTHRLRTLRACLSTTSIVAIAALSGSDAAMAQIASPPASSTPPAATEPTPPSAVEAVPSSSDAVGPAIGEMVVDEPTGQPGEADIIVTAQRRAEATVRNDRWKAQQQKLQAKGKPVTRGGKGGRSS